MNKFIYILIIFLFISVNVYASKTDEIKKINEMFINGYIDENECADLKLEGGKASRVCDLSITKDQASSYLKLTEYFLEAFTNNSSMLKSKLLTIGNNKLLYLIFLL